ncbi:hypothetical protein LPJ53_003234 [Coemansia erecta]|uniref:Dynactin subunit 3 n=1 Tax=Coemansia erecta TaxID=147472 RepID=A0A9W7XWM0_9FUNG|nr:hypothetical protein LPJ53_003234 [Coemansia erecta]
MDILVSRLEAIERIVCSTEHRPVSSEPLGEQVAQIERQLARLLADNSALSQGLEKYDRLRGTIDGDGDLELDRQLLGINAKAELILLNDSAQQTISEMRTIEGLQSKVNQPEYAAAAELLPKIKKSLEPENERQLAEFRRVVADISSIVDRYHTETEALSEIFIEWDRILTGLERKTSELERSAK